jgi:hypothetical protein
LLLVDRVEIAFCFALDLLGSNDLIAHCDNEIYGYWPLGLYMMVVGACFCIIVGNGPCNLDLHGVRFGSLCLQDPQSMGFRFHHLPPG